TIDHVQPPRVLRHGQAVRPLDGGLSQDSFDAAVEINAVHAFDRHLHLRAVAVAGIGEINPPSAVDANVVGRVVPSALEAVGQHRVFAGRQVGASDAPAAARTE